MRRKETGCTNVEIRSGRELHFCSCVQEAAKITQASKGVHVAVLAMKWI